MCDKQHKCCAQNISGAMPKSKHALLPNSLGSSPKRFIKQLEAYKKATSSIKGLYPSYLWRFIEFVRII
ncbi:hypothetical protein EV1_008039 [Malus domestica]